MITIRKKDIPENRTCHSWTNNNYRLVDTMNAMKPVYDGKNIIRYKLDWDIDTLRQRILDATNQYKWWGWVNRNANTKISYQNVLRRGNEGVDNFNRGSYYGGWSIKSNPIYCNNYGIAEEAGGMGELPSPISWLIYSAIGYDSYTKLEESGQLLILTRLSVEKGFDAVIARLKETNLLTDEQIGNLEKPPEDLPKSTHREKDSYFDTWSYSKYTDAASASGIDQLLATSTCQVIRSRVAWQRGAFRTYRTDPVINDQYTWHVDEPMSINTRIIVPIQTSEAFAIEIKGKKPVVLETGYAYSFDTNIMHRQVQIDNSSRLDRIFMVLGFNPWFNWDNDQQSWTTNEYYGKMHPLDMMAEGLMLPSLKFDSEIRI
jgi:hypothetical protein